MSMISGSANTLAGASEFKTLVGLLADHPIMLMLFAAAFTLVCQSSTASLGLALGLTQTGYMSLHLLIPFVLGANLGIGITSWIAGYSSQEGRWIGAANVGLKLGVAVPVLIWLTPIVAWVEHSPGDMARQVANSHSVLNVLVLAVGFALARPLAAFYRYKTRRARVDAAMLGATRTHLAPEALSNPRIALANAAREVLSMGDDVKSMLENAWTAFESADLELARAVRKHDDRIDEAHASIKQYLGQVSVEAMSPRDQHLQFGLLNFISQLESIGDIIETGLVGATEKIARRPSSFTEADWAALREFYKKLQHRFQTALAVLSTRDPELAEQFLSDGDQLKDWFISAQKAHYHRLRNLEDDTVLEASSRFIDVLNVLRRISGLLNTIGHTFVLEAEIAGAGRRHRMVVSR